MARNMVFHRAASSPRSVAPWFPALVYWPASGLGRLSALGCLNTLKLHRLARLSIFQRAGQWSRFRTMKQEYASSKWIEVLINHCRGVSWQKHPFGACRSNLKGGDGARKRRDTFVRFAFGVPFALSSSALPRFAWLSCGPANPVFLGGFTLAAIAQITAQALLIRMFGSIGNFIQPPARTALFPHETAQRPHCSAPDFSIVDAWPGSLTAIAIRPGWRWC